MERRYEQKFSNLLSKEENETIFSLFTPKCESLATTVVQLYSTSPPEHCEWFKIHCGVLCLIRDHIKRSYYFRLFCLDRRGILWEHEIYNDIEYNSPRPFLHTFEAQESIIAFNFASEEEAGFLRRVLLDKLESRKQKRERKSRNTSQPGGKPSSLMTNGVTYPGDKFSSQLNSHPSRGSLPNNKDEKKLIKKKEGKKITKADIGTPSHFRHLSHVGWDANNGFDAKLSQEENSELVTFFKQAGVSKKHLADEGTREFIYEFIDNHGGIDRVVNEVSKVLPRQGKVRKDNREVPRQGKNIPPPLPMRNTPSSNRAAPPPPPSRVGPSPIPPPPPPQRTLQQQSGPPPPPPPPLPASGPPLPTLAPCPPPLPTTAAPDQAQADPHSALMESIRSGTSLRKIDVESESQPTDSRDNLLMQIRQGICLRPVQPVEKVVSGPPENSLAGALAQALAERSRFIHSDSSTSSEDDEDDDDEWED